MFKNIVFLFLLLIAIRGNSQSLGSGIDNNHISKTFVLDSINISKLLNLGSSFYSKKKLDSSYIYYKEALEKAKKIKSSEQIAESLYWIAIYFELTNDYKNAILNYNKALEEYLALGNLKSVANIENYIGYNYYNLNQEDKAIEYYFKSLKTYQKIGNKSGVAANFVDIGNLYYGFENYNFARKYLEDALKIYKDLEDNYGLSACYTNLGNVSSDSGNYKEGIDYYNQSIEIEKLLNEADSFATNFNNIGDCYLAMGNFKKAENYFLKALEIALEKKDKGLLEIIYLNLSELNNLTKDYSKAIFYGNKGLEIIKKTKSSEVELKILNNLSLAFENSGNKLKSLELLKKHKVISDSLKKIERSKKVQLFQALNELEKSSFKIDELSELSKLTQIRLENEKKVTYGLIISMLIFAFLIVILIYQQTSLKKAYNLLEFRNHQISKMNEEIKSQANNLKQLNKTKNRFFSIIAHDLKNPFNSIKGFAVLLIENINIYDEEKRLKFLKIIKGSAIKASDLLDNLLIWANSQSGKLKFEPETIEIVKQVADVVTLLEVQAINKEISIYNNVHHNLYVYADKNMLNTILRNLLSNAIKFTNKGGCVKIDSVLEENKVLISVKDNGLGMSSDAVKNLFNVDNIGSKTGTANEQGSGLGLVLCKEFIAKHDGEISISSKINEGSTFTFTLPICTSNGSLS
ncbi:tetratricopeptide repeat-containing sensor histidine kinase [uncultured Lutibacter sp.]|uniref:tetratricopeptide repeat-containing sensor histidine kinase n=1 Tax=uncultured Lutibacter sp. TaxID=437739 RepID=UPI002629C013|nr:tetratricopeptide repeat-containing sensor histidine kinase [uncultured Lutibacter sp.]